MGYYYGRGCQEISGSCLLFGTSGENLILLKLFTSAFDTRGRYNAFGSEGHRTIYFILKEKKKKLVRFLLCNVLETVFLKSL